MRRLELALACLFLLPVTAFAQGVLIVVNEPVPLPRPIIIHPPQPAPAPSRATYCIDEISINARIHNQIADVQVAQTFENTGPGTIEAQFVFPLPYDGAIDSMTLLVDGKELPAKLMSSSQARQRYEEIVRKSKDPALLEWMGTGMFQTSVFPIPSGARRTVSIHYNQLLRKSGELTDFLFPLSTARYTSRPVNKLSLRITIESDSELRNLYSPSHAVEIKRSGARQATVTLELEKSVPADDFRLLFDTGSDKIGATLLTYRPDASDEGYFLLLVSPQFDSENHDVLAKTISFVVDKSGSMSGQKIKQAREAARFVLNNLRDRDLFNIISYDNTVAAFRPELELATGEGRLAGLSYVDGLYAGGGTNIHDALLRALSELKEETRPTYLLFLTDGLPTSGVTNESQIARAVQAANRHRVRLLTFGVGHDVNSRLLDRLARENHGLSEYVRPNEDIEAAVARVFRRISSPVLTDVQLTFETEHANGPAVSRVYPGGTLDLFQGEQLVVVGRYRTSGPVQIRLTGTVDGQKQTHPFQGDFVSQSPDQTDAFIARLWAIRRIGEIIDELDLNGTNQELVDELVELSTRYGILTPYTAFLADETVRPELSSASNQARAARNINALSEANGALGFQQRANKQSLKQASTARDALAADADELQRALPAELRSQPATNSHGRAPLIQKDGSTLYRRGHVLVTPETAELNLEKDRAKITVIEKFSPEYFELIAKNSRAENELLAEQSPGEALLIQLRGVNYLIE